MSPLRTSWPIGSGREKGTAIMTHAGQIVDTPGMAQRLGVSTNTVIRLRDADKLVALKVGRQWRYNVTASLAKLEAATRNAR